MHAVIFTAFLKGRNEDVAEYFDEIGHRRATPRGSIAEQPIRIPPPGCMFTGSWSRWIGAEGGRCSADKLLYLQ